jgi:hypothetical protein
MNRIWDDVEAEDSAAYRLGQLCAAMVIVAALIFLIAIAWGCNQPQPAHAQSLSVPPAGSQLVRDAPLADLAVPVPRSYPVNPYKAVLPVVWAGRVVSPAPTPNAPPGPPQTVLRPSTAAALAAAVKVPGAMVLPAPGEYKLTQYLWMASGTTLDGRGVVRLLRRGVIIDGSRDVAIKNISIDGSPIDGITVQHADNILIDGVTIQRFGDGGVDCTHSVPGVPMRVRIRNTTIIGHKNSLLGGQEDPNDVNLFVILENVNYIGYSRVPKVYYAHVDIFGGSARGWRTGIDVTKGGRVAVDGMHFRSADYAEWRTRVWPPSTYSEKNVVIEGGLR